MTWFPAESIQPSRLLSKAALEAIAPFPGVLPMLTDPHSLWSLWVPILLLMTIVGAAVYFARVRIR